MSMLNALYITRKNEGLEFEGKVTAALRTAHLRRLSVAKAVAGAERSMVCAIKAWLGAGEQKFWPGWAR